MTPEHLFVPVKYLISGNLWATLPTINVDKVKDIPCDYPGPMGVPITFMDKFNPEQFEIVDLTNHARLCTGREPYRRIVIRNLKPVLPEIVDIAEYFRAAGVPIDVVDMREATPNEDITIIYKGRMEKEFRHERITGTA